jgi:hypothetical protein
MISKGFISAADFAASAARFIGDVEDVLQLGPEAVGIGFELVMYLGKRVHGDLTACVALDMRIRRKIIRLWTIAC